jgi:hypothetical protein
VVAFSSHVGTAARPYDQREGGVTAEEDGVLGPPGESDGDRLERGGVRVNRTTYGVSLSQPA